MFKNVDEIKKEFKDFKTYYLPKIYAFALPKDGFEHALKIGDTYRAVSVRLNEWRKDYPDLIPTIFNNDYLAMVNDDVFFRDHAVHLYLREKKKKKRLSKEVFEKLGIHYSQEFYDDVTAQDINDALNDIVHAYEDPTRPYEYYCLSTRGHEVVTLGDNSEHWVIRENQQKAIDNFKYAVNNGRTNLLMYAVMRFGKSFTSLCCAKEIGARFVAVVSGKAEVVTEWQANVQKPDLFKDFVFKTNDDLIDNPRLIDDFIKNESEKKTVVLFLTLQNISQLDKQTGKIKERLEQVFENTIDLLVVDETHFAARSKVYGSPLKEEKISKEEKRLSSDDDSSEYNLVEANEIINKSAFLKAKIKLHLSGTPYKILADTEFDDIDIISKCQYSDIIEAKNQWDDENALKDDAERKEEWENPYYGFPSMLRFAFNLNKDAREKLAALEGKYTHELTELFMPQSVKKDNKGKYQIFKYENEVLNLLRAIDGSKEDENILPFLDFEPIQNARMCKHLVFVLPRIASCDAMEELLKKYKDKFIHLNEYKILNVAGFEGKTNYHNSNSLVDALERHEKHGEMTITLTVNRFLTGSTIPYWDTMIFLKGTHSAQEYDQSIFRLQSALVSEYVCEEEVKEDKIIKFCKKPQTLLVDFDLNRMLYLQNQKTLIYNVNNEEKGNDKLTETLEKELNAFPLMYLNGDKMVKATAANVLEILSNYSKNRSAIDEVYNIPIDERIFGVSDIRSFIEQEVPINSKNGPEFNANESDEESDIDIDDPNGRSGEDEEENDDGGDTTTTTPATKDELSVLANKLRTYYLKLLFYSYLTNDRVNNLTEVVDSLSKDDNKRIAKNLGIKISDLVKFKEHIYFSIQNILDNKIHNLNKLANDPEAGEPYERSLTALTSFLVMSPTEHVTPLKITKIMLDYISKDAIIDMLNDGKCILDLGCKAGEFLLGLHEICGKEIDLSKYKDQLYAIPTSKVAYEFTRKIFQNLGLNLDNISTFTAYELVSLKDEHGKTDIPLIKKILTQDKLFSSIKLGETPEGEKDMKFGAIVGNPPYQGNRMQIYPDFYLSSIAIGENVCLIFPQGWLEPKDGSRLILLNNEQVKADKQIVLVDKRENVFPGFPGAKSTNIVYWKHGSDNGLGGLQKIYTEGENPQITKIPWKKDDVVKPKEITDLGAIVTSRSDFVSVDTITTGRKPFPLQKKKDSLTITDNPTNKDKDIRIYNLNSVKYISEDQIEKFKPEAVSLINGYKVFIPYAWGNWSNNHLGGAFADIFVGYPGTMCFEDTFLVAGPFDTYDTAYKYAKYLMTHFARALLLVNKFSQHSTTAWHAIPVQDFHELWWEENIETIDKKLFKKYAPFNDEIQKFAFERIQTKDESAIKEKK